MPSPQLLAQLQPLRKPSGKSLPNSIITGLTLSLTQARFRLVHTTTNPAGRGYVTVPTGGAGSLPQKVADHRKLKTIDLERSGNFTYALNTELLGGEQYPVLNFVLGTAVGVASGGAGLLFGAATLALSLTQTAQRVLAREGDEVWLVEEIGKVGANVVHVGSFFLYDPMRSRGFNGGNGWLIHEERSVLTA